MVNVINPGAEVIDYYPKVCDKTGRVIMTPDEVVFGAGGVTYKDVGFLEQLMESRSEAGQQFIEREYQKRVTKGIDRSAGRGHASLATSAGLCVVLKGNCSKFVDAYFTPVKYGSSLMPSGRRVPVQEDQIVVPRGIVDAGDGAVNMYMNASKRNIALYEQLQKEGVKKEEAAKIVQYGHRGGGFTVIPIETLIALERTIDESGDLVPIEMREIHSQLRDFIFSNGMQRIYVTRKNAPRVGCPNPNIFHDRKNGIQELIDRNYQDILHSPVLLGVKSVPSEEMDRRVEAYLELREKAFSSPEGVRSNWRNVLREVEMIVEDFNGNYSLNVGKNVPLRVWGEDKRHRTVSQQAEGVYHGGKRALRVVNSAGQYVENFDPSHAEALAKSFAGVLSLPDSVTKDANKLERWLAAFTDSIQVYRNLVGMGVKKSDAIHVVPRGLKIGVEEEWDLYNLTTGKMSLRLCNSCEPEMRRTTEQIRKLALDSDLPASVKSLIEVKCLHTGFCHEDKCCGKVNGVSHFYNPEFHGQMLASLTEQNLAELGISE